MAPVLFNKFKLFNYLWFEGRLAPRATVSWYWFLDLLQVGTQLVNYDIGIFLPRVALVLGFEGLVHDLRHCNKKIKDEDVSHLSQQTTLLSILLSTFFFTTALVEVVWEFKHKDATKSSWTLSCLSFGFSTCVVAYNMWKRCPDEWPVNAEQELPV